MEGMEKPTRAAPVHAAIDRALRSAQLLASEPKPGGSLAATPCQMMLSGSPRSPDERCCGVTPTVGGNRLYRYCAAHLAMVAHAGGTVYRDADADLKLDANGDLVTVRACNVEVAPDPAWVPGRVVEVGPRRECPLCFVDLTPLNAWHHTVHFPSRVETIVTCAGERCIAWAHRVQDEAMAMRERVLEIDASGVPIGKAQTPVSDPAPAPCDCGCPGCGECSSLDWRVKYIERLKNMEPLREVNPPRPTTVGFVAGGSFEVGIPVRRREDEIAASRAIGYSDRPLAERSAALLYDAVNGTAVAPPPRPDGFPQAQVDAAKAVLLAPVAKRGGGSCRRYPCCGDWDRCTRR